MEEQLESTLESVDRAEEQAMQEARAMGFDEDAQQDIGISLRECMVNAVVHGNRYNARKRVHFCLSRMTDGLEILVGDEGEGFQVKEVPDPLAEENILRQSGRGVMMIKAFMDEVEVRQRQPQGTEVRMVKYLPKNQ